MNATEYLQAALRTEHTPLLVANDDAASRLKSRLLHGAIGLCTEAGELQDALKKHLIYGKSLDVVNVLEEAQDCLWYLAVILHACGSSFEDAFERNIAKLHARFPDKFTEDKALNRDLDAEREALEK